MGKRRKQHFRNLEGPDYDLEPVKLEEALVSDINKVFQVYDRGARELYDCVIEQVGTNRVTVKCKDGPKDYCLIVHPDIIDRLYHKK